ncbi:MAG: DUF6489 family protein [Alphaproteobacteria bacterium]
MKFNFDIECTPEEARTFFGLPEVAPMQERMMQELESRLQDNIRNLSPEEMVKTWMPATMQGWSEMQKMFWGQMGMSDSSGKSKK